MDQFAAGIETLEHQWMRAWIKGDRKQMKALASRDFIFLLASTSAVILDRPSWLEAATTQFRCSSYRFGEIYVRKHGSVAMFACRLTLDATIADKDWSGTAWVTDLWQRSRIRRRWRIVERAISRPDSDKEIPNAIRAMQLWR